MEFYGKNGHGCLHVWMLLICASFATKILLGSAQQEFPIGFTYGRNGYNQPTPQEVATILKNNYPVSRVKLFNYDHDVLSAFANTGIAVSITISNEEIKGMYFDSTTQWVKDNIVPFVPQTKIDTILVGYDVDIYGPWGSRAMDVIDIMHTALVDLNITDVKVTLGISIKAVVNWWPPSGASFKPEYVDVMYELLDFIRRTDSALWVSVFPYYQYYEEKRKPKAVGLEWALGGAEYCPRDEVACSQVTDPHNGLQYNSFIDVLIDAIVHSVEKLRFPSTSIIISETGWPTLDPYGYTSNELARDYNQNIVSRLVNSQGSPSRPFTPPVTYIHEILDEDFEGRREQDKWWGVLTATNSMKYPLNFAADPTQQPTYSRPDVKYTWCLAKKDATDAQLQAALENACVAIKDCEAIKPNGECFLPNSLFHHASWAMNAYYHNKIGPCDFAGAAEINLQDPSSESCVYRSRP